MNPSNLSTILQATIAPCVLISGVGLVLLALTNRLGRPIDQVRSLCEKFRHASAEEKKALKQEIKLLYRRCHLLRMAVFFSTLAIFFVGLIILTLFTTYAFGLWVPHLVEVLFFCFLISLVTGLGFFLSDVHRTLGSIKIEVFERTGTELKD